ncbi:multiple antibiotic resistance (MarC)-like protein [Psychromonas sp. CNPT3]|uniref:MarC family protein n=1 Tax=Psychromonas sp. CNPT3 TaxID=314282 RepID=UPI0002C04C49|nr:MarC family protein [Psychromonas sp. CNPT3]AGH81314.1 multiple antibiotic resistance (MarC)-like protein [Psychromonas sp. CNPT3]
MGSSFPIISTAILIFFILDPFGNIPLLLSILKRIDKKQRSKIIIRELLIGLSILMVFLFFGEQFLSVFHLDTQAITLAGGIIFFSISFKMIFPDPNNENMFAKKDNSDPLIVPIAIPMIAGPAALATLLVLAKTNPDHVGDLFISLLMAWGATFLVLLFSPNLYKILGEKGLGALEKLMGMLLLILSVQMFIDGVRGLIPTFH